MNKFDLFKKFLPGLLPLVVYILADEIWGTTTGLIVAIVFGIIQLIYTYIKVKALDKFTMLDTFLIIILGGISYLLENDIFFKLKPALIGAILCIILGLSAFSRLNIFALMSKRYLDGMEIKDEQLKQFNRSIKILFFIFSFHTLLVIYSAFYMSKEAWAFISTALFYILFVLYFLFELLSKRMQTRKFSREEWLPLVDEDGKVTGKAPRSVVHMDKDLLHPVIHLHLINKNNQIYLQKRLITKLVQPGKWDTSVGGHISVNETVELTLMREAEEELGVKGFNPISLGKYIWKTDIESELVFMFYSRYEGPFDFNLEECEDGRFWKISEIISNVGKNVFTPNFEVEFNILKKNHII